MLLSYRDPQLTEKVSRILARGGIVIMPCDTIYGFVGKFPDADGRIRSVKGRGETKPFLVLSTEELLTNLTYQQIPGDLKKYWPGPLTMILKGKSAGETVAVRVPKDPVLLRLIEAAGSPIFSTSVNRSGESPLNRIAEIIDEFEGEVDLVVDGGDIVGGSPSTIVDATSRPFRILRRGSLDLPI